MMEIHGNVLPLSRYKPTAAAPLFIFVDLQKEFTLEGRPLQIRGVNAVLDNCRKLLALARASRFPVAHVRLNHRSVAFNELECGSQWIDDFKPYGSEMVFEREWPSCYASDEFCRMMEHGGGSAGVLAGLAGSTSCLATLVDAHERGHQVKFAFDASSSHSLSSDNELSIHEAAIRIASQFVDVVQTDDILTQYHHRTQHFR